MLYRVKYAVWLRVALNPLSGISSESDVMRLEAVRSIIALWIDFGFVTGLIPNVVLCECGMNVKLNVNLSRSTHDSETEFSLNQSSEQDDRDPCRDH